MNHVSGQQITGTGDDRLAGGTPFRILPAGLRHDVGSPAAVDGSVNASASGQLSVGGVDDNVRPLEGDASDNQFQPGAGNLDLHPLGLLHASSNSTAA